MSQSSAARYMLLWLLACPISAQKGSEPDFRKAHWGMTQAEVIATEANPPDQVTESNGEVLVKYNSIETREITGRLIYIFVDGKLVRAKYISNADHDDLNDYIADYRASEPLLQEKYGKPNAEKAVWDNDLYQQERLPYLDQDRALPSDILPSDQHAGLSISLGYLRLYTQRGNARTKIVHALTGEDSRIIHQIEYRSVALEALENKVLQRGTSAGR